jgi:co-chaperonin GroES (HSP10)
MNDFQSEINKNIKKVFGKRVLVQKEQLDVGALRLTPAMAEGEKNRGVILAVGQIGILNRLRGIKVGAKVIFNKYFTPNCYAEGQETIAFVELENILACYKN